MRTLIRLKSRQTRKLPDHFRDQDVRYAEELVEAFLKQYTRAGDRVLDPFAGYGTTLLVAEAMGREAYGVELDAERATYIRSLLQRPERLINGDSRRLLELGLPPIDFAMTSPPYMARGDPEDPLTNYELAGRGYEAYLDDMTGVFRQLAAVLRPGGRAVVEVSNLKNDGVVTTLAWDVARVVGTSLRFAGEVVVGWETGAYGYDHSYCLVFERPELG